MVEQSVDICYVTYTRENTGRGGGGCAGGYAGTGTDVLIDNSIIIIIIIIIITTRLQYLGDRFYCTGLSLEARRLKRYDENNTTMTMMMTTNNR